MSGPDLSQSQGHVNPFMATFNPASVAAFHKWNNKTLDESVAEEKKLNHLLSQAAEQVTTVDGVMNFDGLTLWSGDTQEKTGKLIEFHSQLCGVRESIQGKRRADFEKQQAAAREKRGLIDANHGGGPQGGPMEVQMQRRQPISAAIAEACEKQHKKSFGDALEGLTAGGVLTIDRKFDPSMTAQEFRAATFDTDAWDPFVTRQPGYVPSITQPLSVSDIITMIMTNRDAVEWMEETSNVPAAAETLENVAVSEAEYGLTMRTQPVRRIGHFLPVTEEAMADEPRVRGYLDYVMPLGVKQRLDQQIIQGNETGANLGGILKNAAQAAPGTDLFDIPGAAVGITKPWNVLLDAQYRVRQHGMGILGMQIPSHALLHPSIYLECLRSESSSGGYYVGGPQTAMLNNAWGMQVVQTSHLSNAPSDNGYGSWEFGGIIGDFSPMFIQLFMRHEFRTEIGYVNTDFTQFRVSMRSSVRAALALMRQKAFCAMINRTAAHASPNPAHVTTQPV